MKTFKKLVTVFFLLVAVNIYGQTNDQAVNWKNQILEDVNLSNKDYKNNVLKYDFSSLWTKTENGSVFGFIGDDYQRLRKKIISVKKDKAHPDIYLVSGKSMVKNNICDFSGRITITNAKFYKNFHWGFDDEYNNKGIKKQGIIIAEYNFQEEKLQANSGIFEGILTTSWYVDNKGEIKYDDVTFESDGYGNNQFVGIWKSYKSGKVKTANWGDYTIPLSGDLDIGVGEFSPDEKYLEFGWKTYQDAYLNNNELARREENREWWK